MILCILMINSDSKTFCIWYINTFMLHSDIKAKLISLKIPFSLHDGIVFTVKSKKDHHENNISNNSWNDDDNFKLAICTGYKPYQACR